MTQNRMDHTAAPTRPKNRLWSKVARVLRQPLFTNAGYLLGIDLVNSLVGYVFWGLAAHLYSPQDVGIATAILSAAMLVSSIAGLGTGIGLVRFLPEACTPVRLLNTMFTLNFLTGLLVGGGYLAGLAWWSPSLGILQQNGFYVAGFVIYATVLTLGTVIKMAFVARRQAGYALAYTGIVNIGRLVLLASLAGLGAVGLVGSVAVAVLLALIISLWGFLTRIESGYRPRFDLNWADVSTIVPYSASNYVAGLLMQTTQTILPLLILEILGQAASGHAYMALMLGSLLSSPSAALAGSAFAEGSNAPGELIAILIRATALGLMLTLPAALVVGIAAPWILLLFGASYAREGMNLLRWLALAAPMVVVTQNYFIYLRVQKQVGRLIVLSGVFAIATLGIAAALMPGLGIDAGGIGLLAGNGLMAAVAWVKIIKGGYIRQFVRTSGLGAIWRHRDDHT